MTRTILAILLFLAVASQAGAMDDNSTVTVTGFDTTRVDAPAYIEFYEESTSFTIAVNQDDLGEVGSFTWADGILHFEGRMDESARGFVEYINQHAPEFCEGVMRRREKE